MGASASNAPPVRTRGRWVPASIVGAVLLAVGVALFAAHPPAAAPREHRDSTEVATAPISGISSLAQLWDDIQISDGWTILQRGTDYLKASTPPPATCGGRACVVYTLQSGDGCPSGFFVETNVVAGDVVVGRLAATSDPVGPKERGHVTFTDRTGWGRSFQLVGAHCTDR